MKLSLAGTHSSGKTTIIRELQKLTDITDRFTIVDEVTRKIAREGFPVLSKDSIASNHTQILIMSEHIKNWYLDNSILDRGPVDGYVYTKFFYDIGVVDEWVMNFAKKVFHDIAFDYQMYFLTDPSIPLKNDGFRSMDMGARDRIGEIFEQTFEEYPELSMTRLTGTVSDRMQIIRNYLGKI